MDPVHAIASRIQIATMCACVIVAISACSSPNESPPGHCEADPRAEPFGVWTARTTDTGEFVVMLEHAAPMPPRPGTNTWRMKVISNAGGEAPVHVRMQPRRLDGSGRQAWFDGTRTEGGSYRVAFEIESAGLWELRIEISREGRSAIASITLCIAEGMDAGEPNVDGGSLDAGSPDSDVAPEACDVTVPVSCPDEDLTYADVAPIIEHRCVPCHDGRGANWPLSSHSHVVDWADDIRSRMLDCSMPPLNSGMTMPNSERQRIVDWLRCGAPQ